MKAQNLILVLAAAAVLAGQAADVGATLQRAIRKERVEGDLKGAIELYKKVAAAAGKNRAAAAKALLALGECYEKQGSAEARAAYERLVREFGDQPAARQAQTRLTAMAPKTHDARSITAQLVARGPEVDLEGRVTADGAKYVFVDQDSGNVAVHDLKTGAVRRLTNEGTGTGMGDAHGHTPIPSPDGGQIAYAWYTASAMSSSARQMEIRVMNADGSGAHRIGPALKVGSFDSILDWFPDAKRILVYVAAGGPTREETWVGLASIDLTTGEEHRIRRMYHPGNPVALSPDGRWLLFSRPLAGHDANWDIFALDLETGKESAILKGAPSDRGPAWVPGAGKFIFRSDRSGKDGIWMTGFKDGRTTGEPSLVKPDVGDFTLAGVSHDGVVYYGISYNSSDVYTAAVDPQTLRAQGAPKRFVESYIGHNTSPAWAPLGDSFAYYSRREPNRGHQLVLHHPGGVETAAKELIIHPQNAPHWCNGGERLLVWCTPNCYTRQLFDAGSGEAEVPTRIDGLTPPYQLGYTPDCNSAFASSHVRTAQSQQRRIFRVDVETGKQTDVFTDRGEWAVAPRVSPDGHHLALHGVLEGERRAGLLVLPTAGGQLRMLDPRADFGAVWTPDSRRLMYTREVKRTDGEGTEKEMCWISVEGSAPQTMGIRMAHASAPSLNADGKRILFSAGESYNELWVLRNLPLK
ncbi:MAG: PD40 domain-containing protein [Bryobacterales bacterium]|nr:PD40 domain-containing protein [Bryobacterales bacterium]